jgi:hypothetical protein
LITVANAFARRLGCRTSVTSVSGLVLMIVGALRSAIE